MSDNNFVNQINIICDPKKVQTIAIKCRCGNRWTEKIPQELHDSNLTAQFICRCGREFYLRNHVLISAGKGGQDVELGQADANSPAIKFDA